MSRAIRTDGDQGAGNGEPAAPRSEGVVFNSPAAFFAALLGPPQHDAHVECWRGESWLRARREGSARGLAAVDDFVGELREREAQRLAQTHGYDTAALSREFHRFELGVLFQTAVCPHARATIAPRDRDRVRTQG